MHGQERERPRLRLVKVAPADLALRIPIGVGPTGVVLRIVDESADDCLFGKTQFAFVDFPQAVRKKILALQKAS